MKSVVINDIGLSFDLGREEKRMETTKGAS
jgi:hypothetical protein